MKWEYKVVEFHKRRFLTSRVNTDAIQNRLNDLASANWELVSLSASGGLGVQHTALAVLKRPLHTANAKHSEAVRE